jgi:16S rRNA (adenine1518-N6/adenine1519-N6)-dimethyltransferase
MPAVLRALRCGLAARAQRPGAPGRAALARSMGQNFLLDGAVLRRFVAAAMQGDGMHGRPNTRLCVDVGSGPGGLTAALLEAGAPRVVAIELDNSCIDTMLGSGLPTAAGDRLSVLHADARHVVLSKLCDEQQIDPAEGRVVKVVANLPFTVGTRLLVDWLPADERVASFTLLFQREVAKRICAACGTPEYGTHLSSWANVRYPAYC